LPSHYSETTSGLLTSKQNKLFDGGFAISSMCLPKEIFLQLLELEVNTGRIKALFLTQLGSVVYSVMEFCKFNYCKKCPR
jgi:hypothetical protein